MIHRCITFCKRGFICLPVFPLSGFTVSHFIVCSRFPLLSVCLSQLIIQMSSAGSLFFKERDAGMFSTVLFLFVMWNQSPIETRYRDPQLYLPSPQFYQLKKDQQLQRRAQSSSPHNGEKTRSNKREVILILMIVSISVGPFVVLFLPSGAITASVWQPCNNQHNHYYHNHCQCHCGRCHCAVEWTPAAAQIQEIKPRRQRLNLCKDPCRCGTQEEKVLLCTDTSHRYRKCYGFWAENHRHVYLLNFCSWHITKKYRWKDIT